MTVRMTEAGVVELVEALVWTGGVVGLLVVGFVVYLLVRPPRRVSRRRDRSEGGATDAAATLALMERMERRLEVLERAVAREGTDEKRILETGADARDNRRTK